IKFSWSSKFFKNVKEMTLQEEYRTKSKMYYIFPTPGYNEHTFSNFSSTMDNKYTFKITFLDGKVMYKEFEFYNKGGIGLAVSEVTSSSALVKYETPNTNDLTIIKTYSIYLN